MDTNFIRERITQLRIQKNVSEHQMSQALGHAKSYIHGIASGRTLPSMTEFLAICDYLGITPQNFFDDGNDNGILLTRLYASAQHLSEKDLLFVVELTERLRQLTT